MIHTPTPWFVTRSSLGIHHYIESRIRPGTIQEVASCGATEGDEGSEGNAEFIVRAVNAHDDLVAALREARNALSDVRSNGAGGRVLTVDIHAIDAALAKAEAA